MIRIDAATVLVQWAAGGWVFLWVTTRRREVGLGYGWLQRLVFLLLAAGSVAVALATDVVWTRDLTTLGFLVVGGVALVVSIARKSAGVSGQRSLVERRSARVAEMTGIDRDEPRFDDSAPEFPPFLDLAAAAVGLVAVLFASINAGDPVALSVARGLVSALFLGVVSDAMLLGHWYLVQPGLARGPILELVKWTGIVWVPETVLLLWPTGMVSVLNGTIDDAYNGLLGWFWVACVVTTIALVVVTRAALKERAYSAVMAATGLMYLAILTAFGQDLVARILLNA
ncbi:MAG: hypothetical protein F4Y27_04050 [Acidimicrobiaceae bacterium]|nr:hypothetical protein [Acidimicrobiaceae bacterium]MXW61915.1 hypothetical protein [Acidimicrobiaceae bacterium]MYA73835.1 hypothetical protein [Acidimicrobiaceae bacterium]MYC43790.1 hypothetical protein [Acidimicrobiaceae bacterium]MYG54860.1 hypothetical protein [Acidimicrobiaceae bacterium]